MLLKLVRADDKKNTMKHLLLESATIHTANMRPSDKGRILSMGRFA